MAYSNPLRSFPLPDFSRIDNYFADRVISENEAYIARGDDNHETEWRPQKVLGSGTFGKVTRWAKFDAEVSERLKRGMNRSPDMLTFAECED